MRFTLAAAAGLLLTVSAQARTPGATILGLWQSEDGSRSINIYECGRNLCGRIVKIDGAQTDANNVRRSLRHRSLVGVRSLFDMRSEGPNFWVGQTYLPSDGRTYHGRMMLESDKLSTRACLLGGTMCSGTTWVRPH